LQKELAAGYIRLGDGQGSTGNPNLGLTSAAQASYEKRLALRKAIAAAAPGDVGTQRDLAKAYDLGGAALEEQEKRKDGQTDLNAAIEFRASLVDRYPEDPAKSCFSCGQTQIATANFEGAPSDLGIAPSLWDRAIPADPRKFRRSSSIVRKRIGGLLVRLNRLDQPRPEHETALAPHRTRPMSYAPSDLALI
jgi:hypothetical protein